ncbi:MAG: hypothetical protein ACJ749_18625 [Flavisolibacter sp.]
MKRMVIIIQSLLLASVMLVACSKDAEIQTDNIHAKAADVLINIKAAPMPKDSAQIDSLNRPGFN